MANGCYVVPTGWNLVGFVNNQTTTCFASSSTSTVFEGPSGGSCTCGCTMTQPTCASGPIAVGFDYHMGGGPGTCGIMGQPSTMNNAGSCATDMYVPPPIGGPTYPQIDLEYTPPGPSGAACTTSATPDSGSVNYSGQDTFCTPNTSPCTAGMPCTPNLPSPFSVCIVQGGDVACPSTTFTVKHVVGGAATFGCSTGCGCSFPPPAPCAGTMRLYTDNNCMMGEYDISATSAGTCVAPGAGEQNAYHSYHYEVTAPATLSCNSSGSSSPQNLALANPQTICCAP